MNPDNNNVISVENLTTTPKVFTPATPSNPFDYASAIRESQATLASGLQNAQSEVDLARNNAKNESLAIATLQGLQGGQEADRANQYQAGGVNALYNQLSDLNAQATGLSNEAQAIPIQTQQDYKGRLSTQAGTAAIDAGKLRENALKALSLGQQYAIASGNYEKAKNIADQTITAKYAQLEADIKAKQTNLATLKDFDLTPAENKLLKLQETALKREEQDLADKKANEKAISDMLVQASSQNAPSALVAKAQAAKTPSEAAMILGQYAGDYYKTELLKSQIANQKVETSKKYAELKALDLKNSPLSLVGSNIVAPNGDSIGLPTNYLAAIANTKLTEGQSNAVAFVSRMIQADKAIQDQLGTVNTKGGYYETSGYDPTSAGSAIGRTIGSDASRIYNTNAQDFIRAKLRKESGATISPEEMSADTPIYTPSGVGLDEKDLLLAQTKRNEAIKSMIAQAGPAAPLLLDYYTKSNVVSGINYTPTGDKVLDDYAKTSLINLNAAQTSVTPAKQAGYNF